MLARPVPLLSALRHVPFPVDVWCPIAASGDVPGGRVVAATLLGQPLALFRDSAGAVRVLEDRCPHRGAALTCGTVEGDRVRCAYHAWQVDGLGRVCAIPGLDAVSGTPRARTYPCREDAGAVWVFLGDARGANVSSQSVLPSSARPLLAQGVFAHWSFLLDAVLDLLGDRARPFGVEVKRVVSHRPEHDAFCVQVEGTFGRGRSGALELRIEDNRVKLLHAGATVGQAVLTPVSADGKQLKVWLFRSAGKGAPASGWLDAVAHALARRRTRRAFDSFARLVTSAHQAFEREERTLVEVDPLVVAAHAHLSRAHLRRAREAIELSQVARQSVSRGELLAKARRGELALLIPSPVETRLCSLEELEGLPAALHARFCQPFALLDQ